MQHPAFSGTVAEVVPALRQALVAAAGDDAALEAKFLLAHALRCPPGALAARQEQLLTDTEASWISQACRRRQAREPLQYILGEWEFMGLPLRVRPGALIPRPDTEVLAEAALQLAKQRGYKAALDLCCGTGCIGIALAKLGGLCVTFADISPDALSLTEENACLHGIPAHVVKSNWFSNLAEQYDLITCNPPYLTTAELRALQPEVAYEPLLALDGGEDGLAAYREIHRGYAARLSPGGCLLLEVGAGQAHEVAALFGASRILKDLQGIERVVCVF